MKKSHVLFAAAALFALQVFAADYWVVMRDGTRYKAKARPTVTGNRATILMQSGSTLVVDAAQIDVAKSEEVTRNGGGEVLAIEQRPTGMATPQQNSPLGSQIKLRKLPAQQPQGTTPATLPPPQPAAPISATPSTGAEVQAGVIEKFTRAFENVGIFEHKVTSINKTSLHCELTADSEDKVFNVISAAAFLVVHNAGINGAQIDLVEIFMKTTNGGSAGRFQMTQADAQTLYGGGSSPTPAKLQEYFVRKVLY
jgi:hypothetical protein